MTDPNPFQSTFFSVVHDGDIHIATIIRDQLTEDDNIEQFGQDFNLLIEKQEIRKIVLRMNRVLSMSSSFIGKLISIHRKLNRSGGMLVLAELTPDVENTLETSRLLTYFHNRPNLEGAMTMLQVST